MKELKLLLKVYALNIFGLNRIKHTRDAKEKKKISGTLALYTVVAVMMACMSYGYFYGMGYVLSTFDALKYLMAFSCAASCAVTLITTVVKSGSMLFAFKDFDAVMSLPVKKSTVVLSRILMLIGSNLFFMMFIALPSAIAYATLAHTTAVFWVMFAVTLVFLPLLPVSVAAAIGTLVARIAVGFKRKGVAVTILSILLLVVALIVSFSQTQIIEGFSDIAETLGKTVTRVYPLAGWYASALVDGSVVDVLLFIAANAVPFAVFVLVLSRVFVRVNTALTGHSSRRKAKAVKAGASKSAFSALYRMELVRYINTSIYISNTAAGMVMMLLACGALAIVGPEKVLSLVDTGTDLTGIFASVAPFFLGFCVALASTTPCCISIEGKRAWLMKSAPVPAETVFKSKLALSFTVSMPISLLCSMILSFVLKADALSAVLIILMPLAYSLFMGLLGLTVNLSNVKLDWKYEAEIVKQGIPMLISALTSMGITLVPMALFVGLSIGKESVTLISFAVLLLLIGGSAILYGTLRRTGQKKLEAIQL